MTQDKRTQIQQRLRSMVLKNIVAQINEHGVTMKELSDFIANDYETLQEELTRKRRYVDGRVAQSEAAKKTQAKRKERHAAWLAKRKEDEERLEQEKAEYQPNPQLRPANENNPQQSIAELLGG